MAHVRDQPAPVKNDLPDIADLVMQDIVERKAVGIERYGVALQPFNGICRERSETGAYGSARFVMGQATIDQVIAQYQRPSPVPDWGRLVGYMLSIPVVVDDDLPEGHWRLVESKTGEVLYEGTEIS